MSRKGSIVITRKTSSQSLPTIDSLESPKACSTPNHLSNSLLQAGNTKQDAIDADKERKTKQKKIKPWIVELCLNEVDKSELVNGDWPLTSTSVLSILCSVNSIRHKLVCSSFGKSDMEISVTRLCPGDQHLQKTLGVRLKCQLLTRHC